MKRKLQHLDLFSGIGGFSLGLEEIGLVETVAFCDFDKYCQQVLKKHWPSVPIFSDIKELTYEKLKANGINKIDIITGGYPCQPFSVAGSQKGEQDPRHVWPEYFRLVKELKPTWVIGENVSGHIKLGLDTVLENLESEGYSTRTFSISASSVGANHQRERVWIIAHLANTESIKSRKQTEWEGRKSSSGGGSNSRGHSQEGTKDVADTSTHRSFDEPKRNIGGLAKESGRKEETRHQPSVCIETRSSKRSKNVANSDNAGDRTSEYETNKNREKTDERWQEQSQFKFSRQSENVANSDDKRIRSRIGGSDHDNEKKSGGWSFDRGRSNGNDEWSDSSTTKNETMDVADTNSERGCLRETGGEDAKDVGQSSRGEETFEWWDIEPNVGRVAHGIPKRVDRLKSLGNSLVPQIPFLIGSCIKEIEDI